MLAGAHAFAALPEDPQSESTSKFPLPPDTPSSVRPVNWKSLAPNILHDQKSIWTFPSQLAHGEHWKPALGFTAAVGALVALDAYDTPYFRRTSAFSGFNRGTRRWLPPSFRFRSMPWGRRARIPTPRRLRCCLRKPWWTPRFLPGFSRLRTAVGVREPSLRAGTTPIRGLSPTAHPSPGKGAFPPDTRSQHSQSPRSSHAVMGVTAGFPGSPMAPRA